MSKKEIVEELLILHKYKSLIDKTEKPLTECSLNLMWLLNTQWHVISLIKYIKMCSLLLDELYFFVCPERNKWQSFNCAVFNQLDKQMKTIYDDV